MIPTRLVSGQDLVGGDELLNGGDGSDADSLLLNAAGSNDQLGDDNSNSANGDLLLGSELSNSLSPSAEQNTKLTKLSGWKHVSQGGWYLDEELLAVRYMPQGHADPLLAAWAQFTVLIEGTIDSHEPSSGWHDQNLALGKIVPGGCTECHILPIHSSAISAVAAWRSVKRPVNAKPFTKFDHSPHLALPMVRDCRYCHILNESGDASLGAILKSAATANRSRVESRFVSARETAHEFLTGEFAGMQQTQCNACHREGGANDGCTQCHNYHVGTDGFEWSRIQR